ncbi:MAG: signal peptidase II [Candidatus Methylomirabilis sp.]|nr:signal peptidase II [Deltaproteobacteria bacterium]
MKKHAFFLVLALLSLGLDQASKHWIMATVPLHRSEPVIEGVLHFTHVLNKGAAFGFLSGAHESWRIPFFVAVSAAAVILIVMFYRKTPPTHRSAIAAQAMLLGGALGNFYDRMVYGHVVDFIDVFASLGGRRWHWPTFNVADVAITVGVALLVLDMLTVKEEPRPADAAGSGDDGPSAARAL